MSACWKRGMNLAFYSTNRTMSTIAAVETFQRVPAMLNILHYLIPNCIKKLQSVWFKRRIKASKSRYRNEE